MGDAKKSCFRVQFNRRIKLEFHGAKVTSDAGLLLYRELDEVLGLTAIGNGNLVDDRTGKISSTPERLCFASLSLAAWQATKTPTMRSACGLIRS
jgi:hypothetical protein